MALRGATVIAVPAAFTAATGPAHWELLLRARAVENQVFVIGAGQVGELPDGMPACHGHSMIVDPWGTVLAERTEPDPGVVLADLDAVRQSEIRSELPVLANRRPDAYRWPDDETRGDGAPDRRELTGPVADPGVRRRSVTAGAGGRATVRSRHVLDVGGVTALLRDPRPRSPGARVHPRDPDGLQHEPAPGHRSGRHRPSGDPARPARATVCSDKPKRASFHRMDTYADHVVALLDHLGIDTAVVGGVSLGANVSLLVAALAPERVEGLVLEMPVLEWAVPAAAITFVPMLLAVHFARPLVSRTASLFRRLPRTGIGAARQRHELAVQRSGRDGRRAPRDPGRTHRPHGRPASGHGRPGTGDRPPGRPDPPVPRRRAVGPTAARRAG